MSLQELDKNTDIVLLLVAFSFICNRSRYGAMGTVLKWEMRKTRRMPRSEQVDDINKK
jgi:hypothetical protein